MAFKQRQIVSDSKGNYFAVDAVSEDSISLHSVATKEAWVVPVAYAVNDLVLVEGLVEA